MAARLLAVAICSLLAFAGAVQAQPATDQQIEPGSDIILGDPSAPHQLVVYFSPGCAYCMELHTWLADTIDSGAARGTLSVVYRAVPQFYHRADAEAAAAVEGGENGGDLSRWLAEMLTCRFVHHGAEAYAQSLNRLAELVVSREGYLQDLTVWPHIGHEAAIDLLRDLESRNVYDRMEMQRCNDSAEAMEAFGLTFERNRALLRETGGEDRLTVPMLNFDGNWLDQSTRDANFVALLFELQSAVGSPSLSDDGSG